MDSPLLNRRTRLREVAIGNVWEVQELATGTVEPLPGGEMDAVHIIYSIRRVGSEETREISGDDIGVGEGYEMVDG